MTDPLYGYTEEQIGNAEQLKDWCFLYTSGRKNCTIRFMMNREDAMKFCSSPKSKGVLHGNRWMYIFMCVWNWLGEMPVGCRKIQMYEDDDNGNYDYLIEELGCNAVKIKQIPDILVPLGVNVQVGECRKPPKNKRTALQPQGGFLIPERSICHVQKNQNILHQRGFDNDRRG